MVKEVTGQSIADSSIFTGLFVDSQMHHQPPPKLEDFLGGDTSSFQTETQDSSSLTHIYDQSGASAYFNDHHDFKTINPGSAGFQAFSANSGSEVDDSASVARTQLGCVDYTGQYTESGHELALSQCPNGGLSLGGNNNQRSEKALVSVDSDSCKRITDTFGQRTSIYRGVTRYYIFFCSYPYWVFSFEQWFQQAFKMQLRAQLCLKLLNAHESTYMIHLTVVDLSFFFFKRVFLDFLFEFLGFVYFSWVWSVKCVTEKRWFWVVQA